MLAVALLHLWVEHLGKVEEGWGGEILGVRESWLSRGKLRVKHISKFGKLYNWKSNKSSVRNISISCRNVRNLRMSRFQTVNFLPPSLGQPNVYPRTHFYPKITSPNYPDARLPKLTEHHEPRYIIGFSYSSKHIIQY